MHWIRFSVGGKAGFGTLDGDVISVRQGNMFGESQATGASLALADVRVEMPCHPSKMIALWNNSRALAAAQGLEIPSEPLFFVKPSNCYAAQDSVIDYAPLADGRILYEGEIGIVIGKTCLNTTLEQAAGAIFGYTCVNDLTAHSLLEAAAGFTHWTRAKGLDGFGPFGPVIATGLDAASLVVRTRINGRERQNYAASDLILAPAELVSLISRGMTLLPGDVIACGTSTGVGPLPKEGVVEVEVEGVGVLRTHCRPV